MDDRQIIELYFSRDERAIEETDIKYGRLCFGIANKILNNAGDAEECVNDTYLGVWNAIPPTRPENLMAFVCRVARNLSLKKLTAMRRQKRSLASVVPIHELEEILPDECIDAEVQDEDIGGLISDFLRREKRDARNVFIRRYWFCESIGDIARRYSFTESKVKNMLYHTRIKLKDHLIKEGVVI